jgi:TP901 family phage tail tape measure protein
MPFLAGAVIGKIMLDSSNWSTNQTQVQKEANLLQKTFDGLKVASLAMSGVIVAGLIKMAGSANQFEKAFSNVSTVVDTSKVNVKQMSSELLALDNRLGSAADLTEGLYQALSAGIDASKAVDFVSNSAKFAKAALVDTNTAVDVITTGLNAYALSADQAGAVSDKFFQVVMLGKTTGQELSAVIGQSIPLAANFGISLDELGASIAVMTLQGIKSAQATTQFNSAVSAFIKPSEDMAARIKLLGYSSGEAMIKQLGFKGSLDAIVKSTNGNNSELAKMFQNVEALRGVMALTGKGASNFEAVLDSVKNSTGATNAAFDKQELTFETLNNSINKAFIVLGQSFLPILKPVVENITKVITAIAGWDDNTKKMVTGIAATVAIAIPLTMVIGKIIEGYKIMSPIILAVKAGFAFQAAAAGSSTIAIAANTTAVNVQTFALKAQALAQKAVNLLLSANPWAMAAIAIGVVTTAIIGTVAATKNSANETKMYTLQMEEAKIANNNNTAALLGLTKAHQTFAQTIINIPDLFDRSTKQGIEQEIALIDKTTASLTNQIKVLKDKNKNSITLSGINDKDKAKDAEILKKAEEDLSVFLAQRIELEKQLKALPTAKPNAPLTEDQLKAEKALQAELQKTKEKIEDIGATKLQQIEFDRQREITQIKASENYLKATTETQNAIIAQTGIYYDKLKKEEEDSTKQKLKLVADRFEAEKSSIIESEKLALGIAQVKKELQDEEFKAIDEAAAKEKERLDNIKSEYKKTYDQIIGYVQQGMTSIFAIVDQVNKNESTALENKYEKEKEIINSTITDETQKTEALTALDKKFAAEKAALKKKEFISNQIAAVINATIATANAVINVLATPMLPPWVSIPLSVVIGTLGAAQIATIAAQPVPEFQYGGNASGLAIVGERGPELADFRQPAHIYPADQTRDILSGNTRSTRTGNQTYNFNIRDDKDMDIAMRKLGAEGYKTSRGRV